MLVLQADDMNNIDVPILHNNFENKMWGFYLELVGEKVILVMVKLHF